MNLARQNASDLLATAKAPVQARARQRFERILEEAECLLKEAGLSGFSIPILAERLGYTRGSVYAYFPTPSAIYSELVMRYLATMESLYRDQAAKLRDLTWREAIALVVAQAVSFYNRHPVACMLILGGALSDDGYQAQERTIKRLGDLARAVWRQKDIRLPEKPVDAPTLSVEIGVACFRRSYFEHGRITPAYAAAAETAMTAFLLPYTRKSR